MSEMKSYTENPIEKEKVSSADIIVTGSEDKHYFQIKYFDLKDNDWRIGYGSYKLEFVREWLKECFEIVEEKPQTNADRIRSMSDEELAEWFWTVTFDVLGGSTWNKNGWLDWLQSEVKESE